MMRLIDALRYHKPTDEERTALNISSSVERLYLHTLSDVRHCFLAVRNRLSLHLHLNESCANQVPILAQLLLVCGARKGFRFNSLDILTIRQIASELDTHYQELNAAFCALPLEVSNYRFLTVKRVEDEARFYAWIQRQECGHDPITIAMIEAAADGNDELRIRWHALYFQWLARAYMRSYARLRDIILAVQVRHQQFLSKAKNVTDDFASSLGGEEVEYEVKAKNPFPQFLYVLIQKYHHEQRNTENDWSDECSQPPVDSIAQFAIYLSSLVWQASPLTMAQLQSMDQLLQVL